MALDLTLVVIASSPQQPHSSIMARLKSSKGKTGQPCMTLYPINGAFFAWLFAAAIIIVMTR
jgi:hypothetical protein